MSMWIPRLVGLWLVLSAARFALAIVHAFR